MKTTAVRLYGANDLRLETFELPPLKHNEILLRVISDTLCASTYKAVRLGKKHKRVPDNVEEAPVIIGHEMCGEIAAVGSAIGGRWTVGQKIVIQPALKLENNYDPGYSYPYIGGSATYAIVPEVVLERGCMIPFEGDGFYKGSLVESIGCVLRGYKGFYHTDYSNYTRTEGAKKGGSIAILGGAGPMGLAAIELAIGYAGVGRVVVTDLDEMRLAYAEQKCSPKAAKEKGCDLIYVNPNKFDDPVTSLKALANGGFDDVFVMVPVPSLVTMATQIAGEDGCVNMFAGPADANLMGSINLYRLHYDGLHLLGTAGSTPEDTTDTIALIEQGAVNPSAMVTHILGLDAVIDAIFELERPSGAKKVCYPHLKLPLTALEDFESLGKTNPLFRELAKIVSANGGLWCPQAEQYLLQNAPRMEATSREDSSEPRFN